MPSLRLQPSLAPGLHVAPERQAGAEQRELAGSPADAYPKPFVAWPE
jgi:hypothetical protein